MKVSVYEQITRILASDRLLNDTYLSLLSEDLKLRTLGLFIVSLSTELYLL